MKFEFNKKNIKLEKDIEKLLRKSINYRKVSDVEISYLLSGGVDSSLICKFASENEKINTYYVKNKREANIFDHLSNNVSKNTSIIIINKTTDHTLKILFLFNPMIWKK